MKRRIGCELQAENGGFPKENPNLDTTLNILAFLYDISVREDDVRFSRAVDFVASFGMEIVGGLQCMGRRVYCGLVWNRRFC